MKKGALKCFGRVDRLYTTVSLGIVAAAGLLDQLCIPVGARVRMRKLRRRNKSGLDGALFLFFLSVCLLT